MNYKIWNKIDKINNIDAQYFIDDLKIRESDEVFLVLDNVGEVQAVEIGRIIKSVYELEPTLTIEEVAQEYLRIKQEEKLKAKQEVNTLEESTRKINALEQENAAMMYALMMGGLI